MKIAFGCDHAGYEGSPNYKEEITRYLKSLGHEIIDCGTYGPESVDYPDFANSVCKTILSGEAERGVLLCGTGIGISIAANRHHGIRAAVCATLDQVRLSREHNDANVLCLGRRISELPFCMELLEVFLKTPFSEGERHKRRIAKLQ